MSVAARPTNSRTGIQRRSTRRRWIVIIGLLFIVGVLFAVMHLTRAQNDQHTPKQAIPTVIKPVKAAAASPHVDAGLQQLLTAWAKQQTFTAGIQATELTGDMRTAGYGTEASLVPASTFKLYVAYAVLHGIEAGNYSLGTTLTDGNTIQADLNTMITNSDDDAARTLGFMYGWKNINALLQSIGITHTDLYNYVPPSTQPMGDKHTTAGDLAILLQKLYAGQLLNSDHTTLLLNLMKGQVWRERIPAGVPSGIVVADKPGWLSPADGENGYVESDAAIVYGPKSTYILVIVTNGSQTQPLANLSTQVYTYLEN